MKRHFLISLLFLLSFSTTFGQSGEEVVRCGTDELHATQMQDPDYAQAWNEARARTAAEVKFRRERPKADCDNVLYVPVVVHYIGVSIGMECAIDKALDQMSILNEDFAGTNGDVSNWLDHQPTVWPATQNKGSCLEFCLATLNHPQGSGIPEGNFAVTINEYPQNTNVVPEWAGYLNIFVSGHDLGGILGQSPLGGMGIGDGPLVALTAWSSVNCDGSNVNAPYNRGRTATHEIGHYMGLEHPFGNGCDNDNDAPLVGDTPITGEATYGCPDPGSEVITCVDPIVFPTFMEYCDDACLYMFTSDQVDVMEAHYTANLQNFAEKATSTCQDLACMNFDINITTSVESCLNGNDGSITIQALNANEPVSFSINNGLTTQPDGVFGGLKADKYYILVEDDAGCTAIDSVVLKREEPTMNILSVENAFCGDNGGSITAEVDYPGSFQYSLTNESSWQDTTYFGGLSPGAYEVVGRNSANCTAREIVIVGDDSDLNLVDRRIKPVDCPLSDNGLIDVYLTNGEEPFVYTLDDGRPQANGLYDQLGTGRYKLNVRDARGCKLERSYRIDVSYATIGDGCPCNAFVPSAMTPDGDGLNDVFKPVFNCPFTQYHLQIFNRWGEMIFETFDHDMPWNGGMDDYYGNPGVYLYKLTYRWGEDRNESLEVQMERGFITVIR